jgi:hypothetical protein
VGVAGTVLPEDQRRSATAAHRLDMGSGGAITSPPWAPHVYAAVNMSEPSR